MCQCHAVSRRRFLSGGAAASTLVLSGCDEIRVPNLVSEAQVQAMGQQAWDEIRATTPVSRSNRLTAAVDEVAVRCIRAAGEDPADWDVALFEVPEVNAFALPGRRIGIYEGMLGVAEDASQLAAVIGHEIGHVQARHAQERISAELAQQYGLRVIQFLLHLGNVEFADGIAAALGVGMQFGLILPYSRRQELEADRLGIDIMRVASFDPAAAVTLWERMDAMAGDRPPGFLSTHPAPGTRIEKIREMLSTG